MERYTIDTGDPFAHSDDFCDWLRDHGIEPNVAYKVEVGPEDFIVHLYAVNDKGAKYVVGGPGDPNAPRFGRTYAEAQPGDGEAATLPPRTVKLLKPVPSHMVVEVTKFQDPEPQYIRTEMGRAGSV